MADTNKAVVKKINKAFEKNRPEEFLNYCSENVEWTMVGDRSLSGKNAIREFMSSMEGMEPPKFSVDEIVAEGNSVICYGSMKMKMEQDAEPADYSYVDAYRFRNGKVARLQSFVVKHKTAEKKSGAAAA